MRPAPRRQRATWQALRHLALNIILIRQLALGPHGIPRMRPAYERYASLESRPTPNTPTSDLSPSELMHVDGGATCRP